MKSDDLVVITNLVVAVTSIMATLAAEHDVVKAMRDTTVAFIRGTVQHGNGQQNGKDENDDNENTD